MLLQDSQDPPASDAINQFLNLKESLGISLNTYQNSLKKSEFEELSKGIGTWKIKALNRLASKAILSEEIGFAIKLIKGVCLLYSILLVTVHMFKPTTCINAVTVGFNDEERHLVFLYTVPSVIHLLTLAWILTSFAYYKVK